jgi:hypothetical protein
MCTAVEDGILMPPPLKLVSNGSSTLLVRRLTCTLLCSYPGDVMLEVEQVLHVSGQRSHPDVEVRALEVRYDLQALLLYGVLLILNQEKLDRQGCCSGEVALTQGGEGDVRHPFNTGVGLAIDDGPRPWLRGIEGYHHADHVPVQAVGHGQSITVDQSIPVVAKMDECIV